MNVDCVFLSFDEPHADDHYQIAARHFPNPKRLHGVRGMGRAYRYTAEIVDTEWFYVIDADCELLPTFRPIRTVGPHARHDMFVWQSRNPINDLVYGYGGPKLIRRGAMQALDPTEKLDVLAAIPSIEFIPRVACTTAFNGSAFQTWRAGFRECCMLTAGSEYAMPDELATERLDTWLSKGADRPYGEWAIRGAEDGVAFAEANRNRRENLKIINDPVALLALFVERGYENRTQQDEPTPLGGMHNGGVGVQL